MPLDVIALFVYVFFLNYLFKLVPLCYYLSPFHHHKKYIILSRLENKRSSDFEKNSVRALKTLRTASELSKNFKYMRFSIIGVHHLSRTYNGCNNSFETFRFVCHRYYFHSLTQNLNINMVHLCEVLFRSYIW